MPVFVVGINSSPGFFDNVHNIVWTLRGDGILVLTGYAEATWNVSVQDGGSLSRVLVLAGEPPTVNVFGTDADVETPEWFTDTAHEYPSLRGEAVMAYVERETGEPVDGFYGCYEADGAHIGESSIDEGPFASPVVEPPACASIRNESAYCLATEYDHRYALIGVESGDVCLVAEEEQWHFTQGDAVASVDGDDLYACDALEPNYFTSESTIARMRRSTGETTWTDTPCGRIVRVGEQIGVVGPNSETLSVYQDFDAMALDTPAFQTSGIGTARLIELEQVLFGVAFSGVSRTQLPSGAPLAPISLEGDPSIDGFSSALNSLVIYDDDAEALLRFDPSDGTLLETLPMDIGPFWSLESMVCFDAA